MPLKSPPMIRLLLIVEAADAGHMGCIIMRPRPVDGLPLCFEAGQHVIGVILATKSSIGLPSGFPLGRGSTKTFVIPGSPVWMMTRSRVAKTKFRSVRERSSSLGALIRCRFGGVRPCPGDQMDRRPSRQLIRSAM